MLLLELLLDPDCGFDNKTEKDIYNSHRFFTAYPYDDFKKYLAKMVELVRRVKGIAQDNERDFEQYCLNHPKREQRLEYLAFSLKTFRKHIYQEKQRQIAQRNWVLTRNQQARKMIENEVEKEKNIILLGKHFGDFHLY